jgi:hypothetical protein
MPRRGRPQTDDEGPRRGPGPGRRGAGRGPGPGRRGARRREQEE